VFAPDANRDDMSLMSSRTSSSSSSSSSSSYFCAMFSALVQVSTIVDRLGAYTKVADRDREPVERDKRFFAALGLYLSRMRTIGTCNNIFSVKNCFVCIAIRHWPNSCQGE